MDEEFSSALLTGCVLWLLDVGLYPARPAERFARRMPISLPREASLAAHRLPPTNDPGVHPACPGRPRGRAGHAQPPPTTTARSNRRSAGPAPPAPASSARLRLRQTTSRAWTQRATTPTPAIPAVRLPAHRRAPGPHFGRTQRTRQRTDTGRPHRRRTADTGQRTPGRSDARTGHWTRSRGQASVD